MTNTEAREPWKRLFSGRGSAGRRYSLLRHARTAPRCTWLEARGERSPSGRCRDPGPIRENHCENQRRGNTGQQRSPPVMRVGEYLQVRRHIGHVETVTGSFRGTDCDILRRPATDCDKVAPRENQAFALRSTAERASRRPLRRHRLLVEVSKAPGGQRAQTRRRSGEARVSG
jgi:hypothetical protein